MQAKQHYKMYKDGKQWVFAAITVVAVGLGTAMAQDQSTVAHADSADAAATAATSSEKPASGADKVALTTAASSDAATSSDTAAKEAAAKEAAASSAAASSAAASSAAASEAAASAAAASSTAASEAAAKEAAAEAAAEEAAAKAADLQNATNDVLTSDVTPVVETTSLDVTPSLFAAPMATSLYSAKVAKVSSDVTDASYFKVDFDKDTKEATITGLTKAVNGILTIPTTMINPADGDVYKVTSIADNAFVSYNADDPDNLSIGITGVVIGDGVKTIGNGAFAFLSNGKLQV